MDRQVLFESVPNFSEGRRLDVVDAIAGAALPAHILDVDADPDHNRVVISLAGRRAKLAEAVVATVGEAVERIDMRVHAGVHPRVGAADVVPIVPLGEATLDEARELAHELGDRIWAELEVPVYFYGYGEGVTLADIRAGRVKPGVGGPAPHPTAGAVCLGARLTLVAFNVLLPAVDEPAARALARSLRESRGGMRGVQALVFVLPGGRVQLSMNLFRIDETPPSAVIAELERRGVTPGAQQLVGLCPAVAANAAANGRLLEGRLAAEAARAAATSCEERGGEELSLLAGRMREEAVRLSEIGVEQASVLAGAERSRALGAVLRAAGIDDAELDGMLTVAARGFRAALTDATEASYRARVAALDSQLD